MSEAEHQIEAVQVETGKIETDTDTDSKLVQMEEEIRKQKEPEQGDGVQKMEGKAQDESKGLYPSIVREGDRDDKRKRVDSQDEKKDVKDEVDAKQGEKLKKLGKGSKNSEKGEEGKKEKKDKSEKKAISNSGLPEGEKSEEKKKKKEKEEKEKKEDKAKEKSEEKSEEKKKEKKEKKSKHSSDRIQNKLEKIDAKIGRILAKRDEYELRLKEALERERQEAEKAEGREASAIDSTGPGLRSEETDQLRLVDDAGTEELSNTVEKGLPGSLSRTETLLDGTSAELIKEAASQKKVVEKLSKLELHDGSEANASLPTENPVAVITGAGEVLKHTSEVDDSKDA